MNHDVTSKSGGATEWAAPSDHLLRTMGAVPPDARVLVREEPAGRHAAPLAQLGFDVHLCASNTEADADDDRVQVVTPPVEEQEYAEEHFAWIVMHGGLALGETPEALVQRYTHLRDLLRSGGWCYVALPARPLNALFDAEPTSTGGVRALMQRANLVVAERPVLTEDDGTVLVRGIFRRVDEQTPA